MKRSLWTPVLALLAAGSLCGCDALIKTASDQAAQRGWISQSQAEGFTKSATALRRGAADISESEEYYIGRGVAAQILGEYKPLNDEALNRYVRTLGTAVALASDRPQTFIGYRFQVLDSDEVNAFAAPGGFIFVTRGLVKLASSEDELAAALAHEVAHVNLKHGLKTIKAARLTTAFSILAGTAAQSYTGEQMQRLTQAFEGSVDDIAKTLVVKGYSRDKEYEADRKAEEFLRRAGYDPRALPRLLAKLEHAKKGVGLLKTHPSPESRVARLADVVTPADYRPSKARDRRFAAAVEPLVGQTAREE